MTPFSQPPDQNDEHWEAIYSSPVLYKVEILRALLEEEEISAVILNKKDSAYLSFGEIELYVKRDDVLNAMQIVRKFKSDE
jgi:hypothetical protein